MVATNAARLRGRTTVEVGTMAAGRGRVTAAISLAHSSHTDTWSARQDDREAKPASSAEAKVPDQRVIDPTDTHAPIAIVMTFAESSELVTFVTKGSPEDGLPRTR
jgi:hypothetical protein